MKKFHLLIISGLSGSGKSTAIHALEDAGFFCVDNMPVLLLPRFLELRSGSGSEIQKLAFGMDLREEDFLQHYRDVFASLKQAGYRLHILFLEAAEEVLIKRYSQTRRQHPIGHSKGLRESIRFERKQLEGLKQIADQLIDTSAMTVHQLKEWILNHTSRHIRSGSMRINVLSFGFKYGVPAEADIMLDVRFIPNPYFIPELQPLSGTDPRVQQFVLKWPETAAFLARVFGLLDFLLPQYQKEGKAYLTLAFGCTGGRHRSVTVAEKVFDYLQDPGREVILTHRDMDLVSKDREIRNQTA
ncbi:conserved hypothetical protein [uncultured Desulfatiglans sp.]|uniref:Uncharacterized protein n=1 Tax=Uncultured Desulfatiglans sp. TaxID=1748965 RepID=A0A653A128_UNCDX|nr:conserved hypothetical protein [uncultured Desulfatiglans sp.]